MNARDSGLAAAPDVVADAACAPCLIVNPLSFRAARGLAERAAAMARAHGVEVLPVDGPATIDAAVESVLARRQRHVVVLAGDGTVHAIVDRLARRAPGAWLPDLLVLPGGRSNLTAADLVPRGRALATLERALRRIDTASWDAALVERAVLRIEQAPAPPRHGFFVAAALIDDVIRRAHAYQASGSGLLRAGRLSTPWFLLGLGIRALRGRAGLVCSELEVDAGPCGHLQGPVRVLLATTLQHRGSLFDPYAARGTGALRVTAVARDAPAFWRRLPRLLTGRYSTAMNADNGYLGGACEQVRITGIRGYSLDGEAFDTDPARPVVLTAGPRLRFVAP